MRGQDSHLRSSAYETDEDDWTPLPRNKNMVDRNGIEPFLKACKALVPPTTLTAHIWWSILGSNQACHKDGGFTVHCITIDASTPIN